MTIFSDAEPVRVARRSVAKDIGVKQPSERALNAIHCFSICEYLIFLKGQLSSLWINVSKRETASPVFKNELRISFVVNKVFFASHIMRVYREWPLLILVYLLLSSAIFSSADDWPIPLLDSSNAWTCCNNSVPDKGADMLSGGCWDRTTDCLFASLI